MNRMAFPAAVQIIQVPHNNCNLPQCQYKNQPATNSGILITMNKFEELPAL